MEKVLAASVPIGDWFRFVALPIIGGLFCLVGLIIAQKPNAKDLFDKVTPYKGFVGVAMLALGIWNAIDFLPDVGKMFDHHLKLFAIAGIGVVFSLCVVGFLLGIPQIASWIPGESGAEKKGVELSKKLVKYEVPLGIIAVVSGILMAVAFIRLPG